MKAAYDLSDLRLLIVDRSPFMHRLYKAMLRNLNIRHIETAEDGADALKTLQKFQADLILTGWIMSPVDGIEFTRIIRQENGVISPYTPVIMVSAHAEVSYVLEAREAGVNEFLAKPVSANSLYERLTSVIENPRTFVRSPSFTGPDRRRRKIEIDFPGRRSKDQENQSAAA